MAIANVANQPSLSLTCASQQQKALKFLKRASGWNSPLLALGLKGGAGGETSVANGTSGWGPPPAGGAGAGSGWGAPPPPNPVANAAWGAPAPGQPKTQTGMLFLKHSILNFSSLNFFQMMDPITILQILQSLWLLQPLLILRWQCQLPFSHRKQVPHGQPQQAKDCQRLPMIKLIRLQLDQSLEWPLAEPRPPTEQPPSN